MTEERLNAIRLLVAATTKLTEQDHALEDLLAYVDELRDDASHEDAGTKAVIMELQHVETRLAQAHAAIRGLLEVAEIAMPDTFYATDSRVRAAKHALGEGP